jgi:hypothetical protein
MWLELETVKKRKQHVRQVQGQGAPVTQDVPEAARKKQDRQKAIAKQGFVTSVAVDSLGAGLAWCSCGWQEKTRSRGSARAAARKHFKVHLPESD